MFATPRRGAPRFHLQRRQGIYHYRRRIPAAVRRTLGGGPGVYSRSLRTSIYRTARRRAALLDAELERSWSRIRARRSLETEQLVERLYRLHLRRMVEGFRRERMAQCRRWESMPGPGGEPVELDAIEASRAASHDALTDELETAEETGRLPKRIEEIAHELLAEAGETLHGEDFAFLCSELLRAERRAHVRAEREEAADRRGEARPVDPELNAPAFNSPVPLQPASSETEFAVWPSASRPPAPTGPEATPLSEVVALHVGERTGRSWESPKMAREAKAWLERFLAFIGDKPIGELTAEDLRRWRDYLESEPTPGGKKRKPNTVRRNFGHIATLLNAAVAEGYIAQSPARAVRLPRVRSPGREAFTDDELQRIFTRDGYRRHSLDKRRPDFYWIPLVLLHTGARLGEIAQLDKADVDTIEGVHVLRIGAGGKRVKTEASVRDVPIHSGLVGLGFLEHVEKVRRRKRRGMLFPELYRETPRQDGTGGPVSQFFAKHLRERVGITDNRKVMHALRNTVQKRLREAGVEDHVTRAIVGHEGRTMTDHYAGAVGLKRRAEALERIDFREALRYLRS